MTMLTADNSITQSSFPAVLMAHTRQYTLNATVVRAATWKIVVKAMIQGALFSAAQAGSTSVEVELSVKIGIER